ncbi:MAG: hypothetical protein JNJ43_19290 [Anaerolineales bacterium]|nr:hypothetical protein [Anaerolineales bacterium]
MIESEKTENIIFNNHLQVKDSYRFIFSPTNDFSLVEEMIKDDPDLKDIDNRKIE